MKKKVIIITIVIALLILLFPIRIQLKDGGSIKYKSILYNITKVHTLMLEEEIDKSGKVKPYKEGIIIEILGIKIYNNVK